MLHALGYWRSGLAVFPQDLTIIGTYDDEAIAAVDAFRAAHGIAYQGNPPGLVDGRLIDALRALVISKGNGR